MKQTVSDILNCLANLSSDEVFTSPELANRMLDMLPQDIFSDPNAKFLDPCSKSGVFLRENERHFGGSGAGVHLFPFRTEKLSPASPMILHLFVEK